MTLVDRILRLYRRLTRALPEEFQRRHGPELVQTTEDLVRYTAGRRPRSLPTVAARVFADLFWRIPVEHAADVRQDIRYSARMLMRSKGFTAASVLSLGIGIGLTASIFSQVESINLRDVPGVAEPSGLVAVSSPLSYPDYEHLRDRSGLFSAASAYIAPVPFLVGSGHDTHRVWGQLVSPDYFDVLGTRAAMGRTFAADEPTGAGGPVAVVSDRFWQARLGGDASAVGTTLRVNGHTVTILGVAPRDFLGASPLLAAADLWLPVTIDSRLAPELALDTLRNRDRAEFRIVGRLGDGLSVPEAEAAIDTVLRQLEGALPTDDRRGRQVSLLTGGKLLPVREQDTWIMVGLPFVIVGLALWIACSNVGTLLLARTGPRRKEIAIRMALGAGRSRVVRQLITESVVLAMLGGVAGWLFAVWSNSTMDWITPALPEFVNLQLSMSWRALLFTFGVTLVSGVLFGLAPALQAARSEVVSGLKGDHAAGRRRRRWLTSRNVLVLQQVAGSLMLLLITGFVVLGFNRSASPDLGFDPQNVYTISVDPIRNGYTPDRASSLLASLPERMKRLPGIEEATVTYSTPLTMFGDAATRGTRTAVGDTTHLATLRVERVTAGFLETVGVPMVRGRAFTREDGTAGTRVAIVNETAARERWPGGDPIGRPLDIEGTRYEVVGVTRDFRSAALLEPRRQGAFVPMALEDIARPSPTGITVMVRAQRGVDPREAMRTELTTIDPDLTVLGTGRAIDEVDRFMSMIRITTLTYGGIGVFGLLLACVGLAGITAYTVSQQTKAIGIRMALGARRGHVLRLVLAEGLALVLAGTIGGLAMAWATIRAMGSFFDSLATMTETTTSDPLLILGAPLLLGALTMLASVVPARRATRIDPLEALKQE
jgi:predicted permease